MRSSYWRHLTTAGRICHVARYDAAGLVVRQATAVIVLEAVADDPVAGAGRRVDEDRGCPGGDVANGVGRNEVVRHARLRRQVDHAACAGHEAAYPAREVLNHVVVHALAAGAQLDGAE